MSKFQHLIQGKSFTIVEDNARGHRSSLRRTKSCQQQHQPPTPTASRICKFDRWGSTDVSGITSGRTDNAYCSSTPPQETSYNMGSRTKDFSVSPKQGLKKPVRVQSTENLCKLAPAPIKPIRKLDDRFREMLDHLEQDLSFQMSELEKNVHEGNVHHYRHHRDNNDNTSVSSWPPASRRPSPDNRLEATLSCLEKALAMDYEDMQELRSRLY